MSTLLVLLELISTGLAVVLWYLLRQTRQSVHDLRSELGKVVIDVAILKDRQQRRKRV